MKEELSGLDDIRELFNKILGTEVTIIDNIDATDEVVFISMVQRLEKTINMEHKLFEVGGIDGHKLTDNLWWVVENCFKFIYGIDAANIVSWYLYERKNPNGKIVPLEDEDGKKYILKTPKMLWAYIKRKHFKR
tara:strand:+ start:163 stop:564 length:402 start_codon:yes stop_codon:yes gene_type:complete